MLPDATGALRWFAAALLGGAFLWLAAHNWLALLLQNLPGLRRGRPAPAWVPLLGGALGAAAGLLAPLDALRPHWWLCFFLDGGSAPAFLLAGLRSIERRGVRR